ncbi:MAG: hypothetical protein ACRCTY_01575 [Candidatus Adiutrix sp.]
MREKKMIEDVLKKIARQIITLNEETLTALLPKYKERMMNFAPTQQWEEAVITYFLINGLRIKNSQFNDKIKEYMATGGEPRAKRPKLRLVKAKEKLKNNPPPKKEPEDPENID